MSNTIVTKAHLFPLTIGELLDHINQYDVNEKLNKNEMIKRVVVSRISEVTKGCVYVPFSFESTDQLIQAYEKGAAAVVTEHDISEIPCILVKSIPRTVFDLCMWMNSSIDLPSVVVTGSAGKTSLKRMIRTMLSEMPGMKVFCKWGNYNTMQGLCNSFQEIEVGTDLIIHEVDESVLKNPARCSLILHPQVALVTNIADAHLSFAGSRESLIRSVEGIASGMPDDGIVILNKDDDGSMKANFGRDTITVGINDPEADYLACNIRETIKGVNFDLKHGDEIVNVQLSVWGEQNVYNAMMAFIVGKRMRLEDDVIKRGLLKFKNSGIRQNISEVFGTLIYADCYNSSLKSLTYALKCFDQLPQARGQKIAVIGDIGEIEGFEDEIYRSVAEVVNSTAIDHLITYGKGSRSIIDHLKSDIETESALTLNELCAILKRTKSRGKNSYMFKASRFMSLERSIKAVFPLHYAHMMIREKLSFHRWR